MEQKITEKDSPEQEESGNSWITPLRIILGFLLILIILIALIPYTSLKIDPEPGNIPGKEVIPENLEFNDPVQINNLNDFAELVNPGDPVIKQIAGKIVSQSCNSEKICHAKALYYFIRDNYKYISDPENTEYVEDPKEFLSVGGGDCESGAIALAGLVSSVGIKTQLVFIRGHAYIRIKIDEASKKYKREDWIYLDWTCSSCNFGELPPQNLNKPETFLEIS